MFSSSTFGSSTFGSFFCVRLVPGGILTGSLPARSARPLQASGQGLRRQDGPSCNVSVAQPTVPGWAGSTGTFRGFFLHVSFKPQFAMPSRRTLVLLLAAAVVMGATAVAGPLRIGHFSAADPSQRLPDGWETLSISEVDRRTQYALVEKDSTVVLRADARNSAAGVVMRRRVDPAEHPVLEWSWRVNRVLDGGNARTKEGDDYPARIYVTFDHDPDFGQSVKLAALRALGYEDIPTRALNYVWASRVDTGQVFPNAYTDWVQMVPVESGSTRTGTWVTERRNVANDYRRAFGEDPPPISGVAVMTDTDNTGESVRAFYGDIVFREAVR
jgi:hypothetical protein